MGSGYHSLRMATRAESVEEAVGVPAANLLDTPAPSGGKPEEPTAPGFPPGGAGVYPPPRQVSTEGSDSLPVLHYVATHWRRRVKLPTRCCQEPHALSLWR